ncbi:flagellar motor protein MotD [Gammaproteobacteria bacterium AB-CW1]|uniref:Flagellar motor protein MotD n=1 Tax=Natronospira elongata TaxID=3110268 RepID=A0AAP6JGD5_9GAMM|nr:flagellar motor protein MotD [Gammaproteobacteria bacterium AB-CW1]
MARKKKEEEHINHEAWAIPYADMLVLLLAFFVVMYSISSVNEGKYRVLSSSLQAAFRGEPMRIQPVSFGERERGTADAVVDLDVMMDDPGMVHWEDEGIFLPSGMDDGFPAASESMREGLEQIADEMRDAMSALIDEDLVEIRGSEFYIEIEIKADILFPSGVAELSPSARPILGQVAEVLEPFPNPIQVEGHTDNVPIDTERFPSNWELSAGRAASVVHLFRDQGIEPMRLAVVGLGEHRPIASNETAEGRNRNRRVVLTVLADPRFQQRWFVEDGAEGEAAGFDDLGEELQLFEDDGDVAAEGED